MPSRCTHYLVAYISTDVQPHAYDGGIILPYADVRGHVEALIAGWGRADAQMRQEAETTAQLIGRWRDGPTRLGGHLTRIDIFPAPPDAQPSAGLWQELNRTYIDAVRDAQVRRVLADDLGVVAGDPDYLDLLDWLMEGDLTARRFALQDYYALAVRPDIAPHRTAYRPWQWALASAQLAEADGSTPATVERELLDEIARRVD